jgi:hypothetical protein
MGRLMSYVVWGVGPVELEDPAFIGGAVRALDGDLHAVPVGGPRGHVDAMRRVIVELVQLPTDPLQGTNLLAGRR